MVGAEVELGEQGAGVLEEQAGAGGERRDQRLLPVVGAASLVERADDGRAAERACAGRERQLAEQEREQRRLAAAVAPRDGDALTGREVEVDRAEPEVSTHADGALERRHPVAGTLGRSEGEMQLPRLIGLVDLLDALERTLRLAHLGHQRVRPAPVRHRAAGACLVAPSVQERLHLLRSLLRSLEGAVLPFEGKGARRFELAPAAGVLTQRARPRVDLGDPRHRPVEEDAIVGDDREPARESVHEAFEPVEPVEVQIVRRLVEQEHVEAREQDRRQPGPRRLAARERRRLLVERDGQPELRARRARPRFEICASQREEALERGSVRIGAPAGGVALDRRLRVGDAGAARQVGQEGLPRAPVVLLRQVADGQRSGRPLDPALVRLVEPCEQAQQRRLAGPVGADEPEPRARAECQVDVVENGAGAERTDDAVE